MEEFKLPNTDGQLVVFTGELLSSQSSKRTDEQLRWTEIEIYRTAAKKYVVHKVGRSKVVHRDGARCASGVAVENVYDMTLIPCPLCHPVFTADGMVQETDRHTVHVTETGDGVVECSHTQDTDRTTYLTFPAKQALLEAAQKDSAIHEAFAVQRVE